MFRFLVVFCFMLFGVSAQASESDYSDLLCYELWNETENPYERRDPEDVALRIAQLLSFQNAQIKSLLKKLKPDEKNLLVNLIAGVDTFKIPSEYAWRSKALDNRHKDTAEFLRNLRRNFSYWKISKTLSPDIKVTIKLAHPEPASRELRTTQLTLTDKQDIHTMRDAYYLLARLKDSNVADALRIDICEKPIFGELFPQHYEFRSAYLLYLKIEASRNAKGKLPTYKSWIDRLTAPATLATGLGSEQLLSYFTHSGLSVWGGVAVGAATLVAGIASSYPTTHSVHLDRSLALRVMNALGDDNILYADARSPVGKGDLPPEALPKKKLDTHVAEPEEIKYFDPQWLVVPSALPTTRSEAAQISRGITTASLWVQSREGNSRAALVPRQFIHLSDELKEIQAASQEEQVHRLRQFTPLLVAQIEYLQKSVEELEEISAFADQISNATQAMLSLLSPAVIRVSEAKQKSSPVDEELAYQGGFLANWAVGLQSIPLRCAQNMMTYTQLKRSLERMLPLLAECQVENFSPAMVATRKSVLEQIRQLLDVVR